MQWGISDGGVFRECSLSKALEEKSLNIPAPSPLPGRSDPIPYMMVADEAFPLKKYIMKPYYNCICTYVYMLLPVVFRTFAMSCSATLLTSLLK